MTGTTGSTLYFLYYNHRYFLRLAMQAVMLLLCHPSQAARHVAIRLMIYLYTTYSICQKSTESVQDSSVSIPQTSKMLQSCKYSFALLYIIHCWLYCWLMNEYWLVIFVCQEEVLFSFLYAALELHYQKSVMALQAVSGIHEMHYAFLSQSLRIAFKITKWWTFLSQPFTANLFSNYHSHRSKPSHIR